MPEDKKAEAQQDLDELFSEQQSLIAGGRNEGLLEANL